MPVTDADRADVIFALERAARPYGDCRIGLPGLLCKARDLINEQVALLAEAEVIIKHREAAERAGAQAGLEAAAKIADRNVHDVDEFDDWGGGYSAAARSIAQVIRAIDPSAVSA